MLGLSTSPLMAHLLRLAAVAVSLYLMGDLLRQFFGGAITMGHGEFGDRIVVTSGFSRTLALLMWIPFFGGIFLAGLHPGLYLRYRRLLPALLIATFVFYVLFAIVGDYSFK